MRCMSVATYKFILSKLNWLRTNSCAFSAIMRALSSLSFAHCIFSHKSPTCLTVRSVPTIEHIIKELSNAHSCKTTTFKAHSPQSVGNQVVLNIYQIFKLSFSSSSPILSPLKFLHLFAVIPAVRSVFSRLFHAVIRASNPHSLPWRTDIHKLHPLVAQRRSTFLTPPGPSCIVRIPAFLIVRALSNVITRGSQPASLAHPTEHPAALHMASLFF